MRRALVALVTLTLLASCGGGGDDDDNASGGGGKGATKAELIAKGDAICKKINDYTKANGPKSNEEAAAFLATFIPMANQTRDDFEAIVVREGEDPDDVQTDMIFAMNGTIERLELAKTAAEANDFATMNEQLKLAGEASDAANPQAQAYGFKECSQTQ